jgi:rhamnosyl/mannosyltransferase
MPELAGGIPEVISLLSKSMQPEVESFIIVCGRRGVPRESQVDGITVYRALSFGEFSSMPLAPTFPTSFKRAARQADLVAVHLPFPLNNIAIALRLPDRVTLVIHWHSEIYGRRLLVPLIAPLIRHTLRRADSIIVSDESMIATSRFLGSLAGKCSIVPFGTDVDYWEHLDPRDETEVERLRRSYPRLVMATGRLVAYKGFSVLIRAVAVTNANLVIIGEGPLRPTLARLTKQLGVTDRVFLKGFMPRDQLKLYLHAARVFAFPSITPAETFGIAQIEAMAAGLPVINTKLPTGVPKVARHGIEAISVAPNDPAALAAAVKRLLDDTVLARSLGRAGSMRARAEYDQKRFVSRIKELYFEAQARRRCSTFATDAVPGSSANARAS